MTESEATREGSTLFPGRDVRLASGRVVRVEPWGLATGRRLAPRVAKLALKFRDRDPDAALAELLVEAQEEVIDLVRETLRRTVPEIDDDWLEANVLYEDLFALAQAVFEVCVLRADAGGVAGKALTALVKLGALQRGPSPPRNGTGASPKESSSSSRTATRSETSSSTPPSS